jgi:outer membrane protein TolC
MEGIDMSRWHLIAMTVFAASPLAAQDTTMIAKPKTTATLALSDAVAQARANNPDYRIAQNQLKPAKANVKAAKGAFVPSLGTSAGFGYQGAGEVVLGPGQVAQSSSVQSYVGVQ